MSVASLYLDASLALLRRDMRVFLTYRSRVVTQYFGLVFSLGLYYFIAKLVQVPRFPEPGDYFAFVAVGIVVVTVLQSSFEVPMLLRQELLTGTFERLVVSPLGPLGTIFSLTVFPMSQALITAVVTLMIAALLFGVDIQWSTMPLALPAALLGALSFSCVALFLSAMMLRFKQVPGVAYLMAAISIVAGLYFPVDLLPGWLRWASAVQPFTPAIDLLRHLVVGQELDEPGLAVLKLVAFTVVLLPASLFVLVVAIRDSRARGTITEF